jgi:hypothetical protein
MTHTGSRAARFIFDNSLLATTNGELLALPELRTRELLVVGLVVYRFYRVALLRDLGFSRWARPG